MRGPQPDAECPRCHHRQPPSGALVSCLTCGLSYPPKELQHRTSKPTRPPVDAIVLVQPAGLKIDTAGDSMTFGWADYPLNGGIAVGAAAILGALVWSSMLSLGAQLGYSAFLVGFVLYGLRQSQRRPRIELDRDRLKSASAGTLLLADINRVDVDGERIVAVTRYDKSLVIATTRPEIATYVGDQIARRIRQPE
jgi:hypothetical protein